MDWKSPPPHLKVFQKIIFWGGARQASLDFTFSSLFVDQIVYILSSGSQEQNLRQIYRLLDDKQVTFTLFGFWFGLVFLGLVCFFFNNQYSKKIQGGSHQRGATADRGDRPSPSTWHGLLARDTGVGNQHKDVKPLSKVQRCHSEYFEYPGEQTNILQNGKSQCNGTWMTTFRE